MKCIGFSAFFLCLCFIAPAQNRYEKAKEQMKELRNGMLLVRLQTREANIQALKERGRKEEAKKLEQKQRDENKETLLAFSQVFDFAPVYFFYSHNSDAIRQGDFSGNIFDKDRNEITETQSLPQYYFTGEFGETERLDIDGFVIMDSTFTPLEPQFPYYSRKYTFFGLVSRSKGQMVERLNEKLHTSYELWFEEGEEPQD